MTNLLYSNYKVSLIFYVFLFLIVSFLSIFDFSIVLTDFQWSWILILFLTSVYLLRYINNIGLIGVYSLFYFTTIVFLCGRFFSVAFGFSGEIFLLDFFSYRLLNDYEKNRLMSYLFCLLICLEVGLYSSRLIFIRKSLIDFNQKFRKNILWFLFFVIIISLILSMPEIINKVLSGGYLALHKGQSDGYSFGLFSKLNTLLYTTLGFALAQDNKNLKKAFIGVLIIYSVIYMVMGARGTFVCSLLFLIWVKYRYGENQVNIIKLLLYFSSILFFLISLFSIVSIRGKDIDSNNSSFLNSILQLLYDQGITLMVFNEVFYIDNYPILPMIQNFIPGSVFFASKIGVATPYNISYGNYLASELDYSLFSNGYGLGWSVYSDLYVISFGSIFIFGVAVILFSFFLNYTESMINKKLIWRVIVISTLPALLFLPRSGLYTYFPLMFYVLIMYFILHKRFGLSK